MPETKGFQLDYGGWSQEGSRLRFRGDAPELSGRYVTFMGGTEVFGRFVERPVSECVEDALRVPCINLGLANAGPEAFLRDPGILALAGRAAATVVQITGAQNTSNRFFRVHPRRNDRVISTSPALQELYPQLDMTDVHFTRHVLARLAGNEDAFEEVVSELKIAWSASMTALLAEITGPKILFWMARRPLAPQGADTAADPLFVDAEMVWALKDKADDLVVYRETASAAREALKGMTYLPQDADAARCMMGQQAHEEAARALVKPLAKLLKLETVAVA